MLYGTTLRLPGEFFVTRYLQANSAKFLTNYQRFIQTIKPVPTSHHSTVKPFQYPKLSTCIHVFKRVDTIRKPLQPPYTGPHKIIKRLNDKTYVIKIDELEKVVSTDSLKPAFLETNVSERPTASRAPVNSSKDLIFSSPEVHKPSSSKPRRVSFPSLDDQETGGGVVVADPSDVTRPMTPPHTLPAVRKKKQILIPRPSF
ncbi:uncharacterized protein [Cardiocondyla obscurior]|uniref:uncharacterized protein n=1 Tax=Cardiocondyla obscurior TaxID=286306 RepID=UPI00396579D3